MTTIGKNTEKEEIINTLIDQKAQCYKLVVILKMLDKPVEAEDVKNKALNLSATIDDLLEKLMDEWLIDTAPLLNCLIKANNGINDTLDQIKKMVDVAENVVKFLKNIDQGIEVASKIILSKIGRAHV